MVAWVIRTRATPASLSSTVQSELREAVGGLPVARVHTMEETLSRSTSTEDFNTLVMTIFGCSALVLAAIGIYGLLAYSVAQRSQEIGIRLALGAESSQIRNMMMLQGLRPSARCDWWACRGFWVDPPTHEFLVWREGVGPAGVFHCSADIDRRGAGCSMGAGAVREPGRSHSRAAV
jgi:hypothetical protein